MLTGNTVYILFIERISDINLMKPFTVPIYAESLESIIYRVQYHNSD